ncbi:hypothetical protein HID58_027876 [Brassica napus]|uniref:Thioredoxin-like fold domain-containing protein n=1 Tax=Brassica napus TaxID=3708 RepID=A0ABQ8CT38_BRANA|nr:hypothetical protein HID58_027876 [Brassica napus]
MATRFYHVGINSTARDKRECLTSLPSNLNRCFTFTDKSKERENDQNVFPLPCLLHHMDASPRAAIIPPSKPDGFVYPPGRRVDPDSILIEAFYDPVCPYSRDSWPPLKQALNTTDLAFPCSSTYFRYPTFSLLEGFFKHQAMFYGAQTQLLTRPEVVGRIVKLGTATLGNSYHHVLKSGFNDTKSERATRVSFKYSASRGVYGTPTFSVNGFALPDADDPSDFGGWKKIIDSLVQPHKVQGS